LLGTEDMDAEVLRVVREALSLGAQLEIAPEVAPEGAPPPN
jgi:hypothetical protein